MRNTIVIERTINAPIERVFDAFITPEDIMKWHHAGGGWKTPYAEVNPTVGGKLKVAYADPDGNVVFELVGEFTELDKPNRLAYMMDDERLITVELDESDGKTTIRLELDVEDENSKELQTKGWTEHLDNLSRHLM